MSFEGHTQSFCLNGHHQFGGVDDDTNTKCYICGATQALVLLVDDTNCEQTGCIPPEKLKVLLITPEKKETCNLGHIHVIQHPTYKVPSKEDLSDLISYWDPVTKEYKLLKDFS
jgi:hypothetical protein